jgi:hypothetical protein
MRLAAGTSPSQSLRPRGRARPSREETLKEVNATRSASVTPGRHPRPDSSSIGVPEVTAAPPSAAMQTPIPDPQLNDDLPARYRGIRQPPLKTAVHPP